MVTVCKLIVLYYVVGMFVLAGIKITTGCNDLIRTSFLVFAGGLAIGSIILLIAEERWDGC